MKSRHCFAALLALALAATTSLATAQERSSKESIAGKAAAAPAAKASKSTKAVVQPAAAALKTEAPLPASKPAGSDSTHGLGKEGSKSDCHSKGSDA